MSTKRLKCCDCGKTKVWTKMGRTTRVRSGSYNRAGGSTVSTSICVTCVEERIEAVRERRYKDGRVDTSVVVDTNDIKYYHVAVSMGIDVSDLPQNAAAVRINPDKFQQPNNTGGQQVNTTDQQEQAVSNEPPQWLMRCDAPTVSWLSRNGYTFESDKALVQAETIDDQLVTALLRLKATVDTLVSGYAVGSDSAWSTLQKVADSIGTPSDDLAAKASAVTIAAHKLHTLVRATVVKQEA